MIPNVEIIEKESPIPEPKLEQIAEELEKIHGVETLNMLAEHYPKRFAYEIKMAKRFFVNEPKNNIVSV